MSLPPLPFRYEGGAFWPHGRYAAAEVARRHGEGEVVRLVEHEERSRSAHNHFFVCVERVFENLSDEQRLAWPTEDALRKYVLCKVGYCDVATHVAPSKAEAKSFTAFLRSIGAGDIVVHDGAVVTVLTARSMKYRAMDKATFREVADKALPVLASIIGVDPATLLQQREAA